MGISVVGGLEIILDLEEGFVLGFRDDKANVYCHEGADGQEHQETVLLQPDLSRENITQVSPTQALKMKTSCHFQSFLTPTTIKGKTRLMKKKLSQFTDPAIMYAAGREVCVNSSVVKMFVTPPSQKQKQQKKSLLVVTVVQQQLLTKDFNGGKRY